MARQKTSEKILQQMGDFVEKVIDGNGGISLDTMINGMPCAEQGKFFIKVMDLYMQYTMSKPKQDINLGAIEFNRISIIGETQVKQITCEEDIEDE